MRTFDIPFGDPTALPPFGTVAPDRIVAELEDAIAEKANLVAAMVADRPTSFADLWLPLEHADNRIEAIWSAMSHLHAVSDSAALRAAYADGQAMLTEHQTMVGQNRELFELLTTLASSPSFQANADADRAAIDRAIRDFKLAGVNLDRAGRDHFRRLAVELSMVSNDFSSAVQDATDAWSEHVTDPSLLEGLPDADVAMFAAAAEAQGLGGWLVTLQMPSVAAVIAYAENRDLRERIYRAFGTRASDQGPHADQFDNGPRIQRILQLRRELAALLGFGDPVEWSLETKMVSRADEVLSFLRDLAAWARPSAENEFAELAVMGRELGIAKPEPWDLSFLGHRLRQARYDLDDAEIRSYFPIERVLSGWRRLLDRLFSIRFVERNDVELWHPDARFLDVVDSTGSTIAGLYLDLHSREGKRGGAWMAQARSRLSDGTTPVAYLVCNFAPLDKTGTSFLTHADIITLLHETGHCLHHLFTLVDRPSIAGTNGFEWDAIELPSQLMEDFGWDREVIGAMSGHPETGEPLPDDLFARMCDARQFQAGLGMLRQIEYALFDLILHLGTMGSDPIEVLEAVRDEVAVVRPPEWHRFVHAGDFMSARIFQDRLNPWLPGTTVIRPNLPLMSSIAAMSRSR